MGNTRREFTPEFKDEAVKLVINTGRSVATVARELGVNEATLGRWVNLFKASQDAGEAGITEMLTPTENRTTSARRVLGRIPVGVIKHAGCEVSLLVVGNGSVFDFGWS